jgi:hypothetical protein
MSHSIYLRVRRCKTRLLGIFILLVAFQLLLLFHLPKDQHDASHYFHSYPLPQGGDDYDYDYDYEASGSGGTLQTPKNLLKIRDDQDLPAPAPVSVDNHKQPLLLWSNGLSLKLVPKTSTLKNPLTSVVHCVGDNFLPNTAWMYRSCQYRNLCYNTSTHQQEFVIYPSSSQKDLETAVQTWGLQSKYARISTSTRTHSHGNTSTPLLLSLMGTTPWWARKKRYAWTVPESSTTPPTDYYELSNNNDNNNTLWIPCAVKNNPLSSPLTLFTETLLPLYNLVRLFFDLHLDLEWPPAQNNNHNDGHPKPKRQQPIQILVTILNPEECDEACRKLLQMGLALMGAQLLDIETSSFSNLDGAPNTSTTSSGTIICAKQGVAGMGMLTANGLSRGGHVAKDFATSTNVGRGRLLWDFRNHVLRVLESSLSSMNMDMGKEKKTQDTKKDFRIQVTLVLPSSIAAANNGWGALLQENISKVLESNKDVELIKMESSSVDTFQESIRTTAGSNIFVSLAGEDPWPAMFLPRDSAVILLYDETKKAKGQAKGGGPQPILDHFDLWNNLSYLQVHWLSLQRLQENTDVLVDLIKYRVDLYSRNDAPSTPSQVDGTFNGKNVRLVTKPRSSQVHCVGENWEWDSANYRSCNIQHLCVDISERPTPFVLQRSSFDQVLNSTMAGSSHPYDLISTRLNTQIMVGHSLRLQTGEAWFPSTTTDSITSYYDLDPDVVWLPYYAEQPNANNPGHLLWDYFLPLFNLVAMFGLDNKELLLTNLDQWCIRNTKDPCFNITAKFLPLLGVEPATLFNSYNPQLQLTNGGEPKSKYVCARHGAAGIGMLTDHGYKKHGQLIDDYKIVQNAGRGPFFWEFRNFMLANMRLDKPTVFERPYQITISINSSTNLSRKRYFSKQVQMLRNSFSAKDVVVRTVNMGKLPLPEQIQIVKQSAIFVSVVGGAASTAMFLERNACLVLLFDDVDDFVKFGDDPNMPNMMDWDFWNHASYLRVHWLPLSTMGKEADLQVLVQLARNELKILPRLLD